MTDLKQVALRHTCLAATLCIATLSHAAEKQSVPSCHGEPEAAPAAHAEGSGKAAEAPPTRSASGAKPHSVRLSWQSSVPASSSPGDAIKGYNVYRRRPSGQYIKINVGLIHGTGCTDDSVGAGQTYYYKTNAVSASGAVSGFSQEIKANVPAQ